MTKPYWLDGMSPGKLAVASRPRGSDWLSDEMSAWRQAGIDVIVSLLTPVEENELELRLEAQQARHAGLEFVSFPIVDRSVPTSAEGLLKLVDRIDKKISQGKKVVIHCRQGIGRSGLVAASLLVSKGLSPGSAFEQLSASRGVPVPETAEQRDWLAAFAKLLTPSKS